MVDTGVANDTKGLLQIAKWISLLILSGSTLSACVCVLRLLKQTDFTVGQLKLSLSMFPYIIASFTGAHCFLAWIFSQRVAVVRNEGLTVSKEAWSELINSEAFVFFNMKPRIWSATAGPFGIGTYVASSTDTAFWCTFAFATVLIAAVVASRLPISTSPFRKNLVFDLLSIGCVIALVNWIIGSQWSIAATSLLGK
jgi:hypothetical protein